MPAKPKDLSGVIFCISLRERRMREGITQSDLAKRSGLTWRQICSYELGTSTPNVDQALAIAKALGASLDQMCGYDPHNKKETNHG